MVKVQLLGDLFRFIPSIELQVRLGEWQSQYGHSGRQKNSSYGLEQISSLKTITIVTELS